MNFLTDSKTINPIDVSGTSRVGSIVATRGQLEQAFGQPRMQGDKEGGGRVTCEWRILFENMTIATIYDYTLTGVPGLKEVFHWSIGGVDRLAVELVHQAFREWLATRTSQRVSTTQG